MKLLVAAVFGSIALIAPLSVWAVPAMPSGTSIRIEGRADAVVTDASIRLSDIALIDSPRVQDDETIILLKQVVVANSPKAGEKILLNGTDILARLRDEGVKLDSVRYTLPRHITVTRAFREVLADELEQALGRFLEKSGRQVEVRQLLVNKPVRIPTDSYGVEVVALKAGHPGHFGADFRAVAGSEEARFQLGVIADEWRLMPVATRPLRQGSVVTGQDIELSKVNGTSIGRDSIENLSDIVGQSLTRNIGQGEMFRNGSVVVPPIIKAGARVTLLFKKGRLEATATGTALDSGSAGQEIKVRNESSKKIIVGKAIEPGIVEVGAE